MICWIIPIIVGLLCALLGYLLGKMCSDKKVKKCKSKCEKELRELKEAKAKLQKELDACRKQGQAKMAVLPFSADKAKSVFGKKIKENDLTVVEGIGPKIQELFHSFNIKTWKDLSETSVERCKEILATKGDSYLIHKPGTWPRQADMAYKGKWKELKEWQDVLKGGVE